jgi:hypothetical protein
VQQYPDETKRSQAQDLKFHHSHAPTDSLPTAVYEQEQAMQDSAGNSRRFQKLNGLERGTKTMVNPDQNIVVEAGEI